MGFRLQNQTQSQMETARNKLQVLCQNRNCKLGGFGGNNLFNGLNEHKCYFLLKKIKIIE